MAILDILVDSAFRGLQGTSCGEAHAGPRYCWNISHYMANKLLHSDNSSLDFSWVMPHDSGAPGYSGKCIFLTWRGDFFDLRGTCERLFMLMHHTRHMIVGHFGTMNCNGAGVDISPSCNENVIGISWEIATFWGCCSGGSITREEMARWPGGRAPSTVSFPNTSAWHCFSMWNPEYRRIE